MNFTIARDQLIEPLQLLTSVVETNKSFPILGHFLLEIKNSTLTLSATDLEIQLILESPFESAVQDVAITLPAKKFLNLCRALSDKTQIAFNCENERAVIKAKQSRFTLASLPADQFPAAPQMDPIYQFRLTAKQLRFLIENCYFAMAQQDVRYFLNGLFLEIKPQQISAICTNGHRLSCAHQTVDNNLSGKKHEVIIPRKTIIQLLHLLDEPDAEVTIALNQYHIQFSFMNKLLISKLIEGKFPDYNSVIPKQAEFEIVVDRQAFKQMLERVSIIINDKFQGVSVQLRTNLLKVVTYNAEQEEAEEEMIVDYRGENFEVGFNVSYLLDILQVIASDQIKLGFGGPKAGLVIQSVEDDNCLFMVMPMSL
jgi:DNA polymerase-3 subunit beta